MVGALLLGALLTSGSGLASAQSPTRLKTVRYHGYSVTVPRSWPVLDLRANPLVCVRFDRHAVYLGLPSSRQRCPSHAAGRTEAILIEPAGAATAHTAAAGRPTSAPALDGSAGRLTVHSAGVVVTATWSHEQSVIEHALHGARLEAAARPRPSARAMTARASAGAVYTGLGFDACSAPSAQTMTAWGSSPYRAIGVYIGGANSACSQPNLTPSWVSAEVAAGWQLIPTYVGLQAPSNSCGCKPITPAQASAQGTAAAQNAIANAQALGIGPGNPIYDDMEAYPPGGSNTAAVLAFLSGWTSGLHAGGYVSGVYSSSDSGIADLAASYGTSYLEPDDLWIANWNGSKSTTDPNVASTEWPNHQRLHQYSGSHNETYGGATLNIDGDYLDGATAGTGSGGLIGGGTPPPAIAPPTLAVSPTSDGTTHLATAWNGGTGLSTWNVLAGDSSGSLTPILSAPGSAGSIAVHSAAMYFATQALDSAGNVLASSPTVAAPSHLLLFGRSSFVNLANGVGGMPAGCYAAATCHVAMTLSAGHATIATTGTESISASSSGILYFTLTAQGRSLLSHARYQRLAVRMAVHDATAGSTSTTITLVPFRTKGRGPARALSQSPIVQIVGATDFVFAHGSGGILARCALVAPCHIAAKLSVGRTTIASTSPESIGGDELGYVIFSLTPRGRALLGRAAGNQLGARLTLSYGTEIATGTIALVQFN